MNLRSKLPIALIILALLGSSMEAFAASFRDTDSTRFASAFDYMHQRGAVKGFNDGSGRPYNPITRIDALKVLIALSPESQSRLSYYKEHMPRMPLFRDVDQQAWYAPYIETAFEAGWITGQKDHTFRPADLLTTNSALAIALRATGEKNLASNLWKENFDRANARHLIGKNIVLNSGQRISRGQYFDMLYRVVDMKSRGLAKFTDPDFPDPPVVVAAAPVAAQPVQSGTSNTILTQPSQGTQSQNGSQPIAQLGSTSSRPIYGSTTQQSAGIASLSNPRQPWYSTTISTPPRTVMLTQPTTNTTITSTPPRTITLTPQTTIPHAVAAAPGSSTSSLRVNQFTIDIPRLGIQSLLVTHPSDPSTSQGLLAVLQSGVGHLFSYPGGGGKILIYGHSSGYPWDVSKYTKIFRQVNQLHAGDRVTLNYAGRQYVYEVTTQEQVNPKDTRPYSGAGEELLLYTCWPPDSISTRLLVHAKPVGTAQ